MNIFDQTIKQIINQISKQKVTKLNEGVSAWNASLTNPFLMERDTYMELGGYPKESINIYVPSSNMDKLLEGACDDSKCMLRDGIYLIGDASLLKSKQKHISFGKIILLSVDDIPDDKWYDFTQKELLTDAKNYMQDIMQRQSPTHYTMNLRIGKKAIRNGFCFDAMGKRVHNTFSQMEYVKDAVVILLAGDNDLYKSLLEQAERIKEITLTLNHIFDGIDMDCGHCDLSVVCNEVEGMRELHKKQRERA